jgi:hypothetical protein
VTVTDEEFVDRAHADGYAVHVWTINEEREMRQLLAWGVDGIMTAEPMRLERVLCRTGTDRPRRPRGTPGAHCTRRGSIACRVTAVRASRAGKGLRVVLRRSDGFSGRCAGMVTLRPPGSDVRPTGRFSFGWKPPSEGGPRRRVVQIKLFRTLRGVVSAGTEVGLTTRPYTALPRRRSLRVG